MPRRKKLPPLPDYTDGGRKPETHLIQKSNPLLSLSETDMTLPELKILDVYLDRIDSHDEEKRTVQFEKGEIERMLGVSRILKKDLEKRLRHLAQVVKIEDETKPKGFKLISLFEEIGAWQDDDGLWQISLTCTNRAREYVFNIDNIGYLRYRLKSVIGLTSRYSYVLYLWLEHNRFRHSWEVELAELKALLQCTADTYSQFYRFNDLVLKKCQKEILEKTDCRFTYESIKRGKAVKSVRFTVETSSEFDDIPGQISLPEVMDKEIDYGNELADLLGSCACQNEFSPEQVRILQDLVLRCVHSTDNIEICDFLLHQVNKMNYYESRKPIKNRFEYLCSILKNEYE